MVPNKSDDQQMVSSGMGMREADMMRFLNSNEVLEFRTWISFAFFGTKKNNEALEFVRAFKEGQGCSHLTGGWGRPEAGDGPWVVIGCF